MQSGEQSTEARNEDETIWLSQKLMAALFAVDVRTVCKHLKNIVASGESDGKSYATNHYNLDAIISCGMAGSAVVRRCADHRWFRPRLFLSPCVISMSITWSRTGRPTPNTPTPISFATVHGATARPVPAAPAGGVSPKSGPGRYLGLVAGYCQRMLTEGAACFTNTDERAVREPTLPELDDAIPLFKVDAEIFRPTVSEQQAAASCPN